MKIVKSKMIIGFVAIVLSNLIPIQAADPATPPNEHIPPWSQLHLLANKINTSVPSYYTTPKILNNNMQFFFTAVPSAFNPNVSDVNMRTSELLVGGEINRKLLVTWLKSNFGSSFVAPPGVSVMDCNIKYVVKWSPLFDKVTPMAPFSDNRYVILSTKGIATTVILDVYDKKGNLIAHKINNMNTPPYFVYIFREKYSHIILRANLISTGNHNTDDFLELTLPGDTVVTDPQPSSTPVQK